MDKTNPEIIKTKIESKALASNLAVTSKREIIIPESQRWLLDCTASYFGIQKRTKQFLEELNHPYSNTEEVLSLMRQSIFGDLWFFLRHPEAEKALRIIMDVFQILWHRKMEVPTRSRLLNLYLEIISAISNETQVPSKFFDDASALLQIWHKSHPDVFIYNSGQLLKALLKLRFRSSNPNSAFLFVRSILEETLQLWQEQCKLEEWLNKQNEFQTADRENLNQRIGSAFFQDCLSKLQACQTMEELITIPHHGQLSLLHREMLNEFSDLTEKIHYLFYLMKLPVMSEMQDHLLFDLNRLLQRMGKELDSGQIKALLETIFSILKEFKQTHNSIVLDCIQSLGKALINQTKPEVGEDFLRRTIDLGFTPPGTIKINQDWQLDVDSNHVKNIRIWLEIMGLNPLQTKNLMAALIINLTQKGVFISDTDLFQKDVSAFLNSKISPLYVQVKQLLRLFSVFYNENGAEGEIRDISTEIDEICQREDKLIHFLRKQIHTESNNTHIKLVQQILKYWLELDSRHLIGIIPSDVEQEIKAGDRFAQTQHTVLVTFLKKHKLDLSDLLDLSWQSVIKLFETETGNEDFALKRLRLLLHIYYLLLDKYRLDPYDIFHFLNQYKFFNAKEQARLRQSLDRNDFDSSIRQMLIYIKKLNMIVLDPLPTQAWENIYYKRHIAAGIPSMYGSYREPKLEAMGMIFRLENVIRRLIVRSINQINLNYINAKTIRRISRILDLFHQNLEQEGFKSKAFAGALVMLESSRHIMSLSIEQYIDIFNLMKDSINELIDEYFYRFYDSELRHYTGAADRKKPNRKDQQIAEEFYRKLLSSSFLVQELDNFIAQIIVSLNSMKTLFNREQITKVMSYDPDLLFVHLNERNSRIENQVLLGSKAYFLKQLQQFELPVPPGFVITTELFRHRDIINMHSGIEQEIDDLLRENINKLEQQTGLHYGAPQAPLLFSVRSGAPMSLPGAMNTFLNIGLNDEITYRLSLQPNFGWTAWDCYRRLIQSWGMAYNIDRDEFDNVMIEFKRRFKVQLKAQFTPAQMRDMCVAYKEVLGRHNVVLEQDSFLQIKKAIIHVLDSWNTDRAVLYRQRLHIADEWGTAVTIQKMVLGNISLDSGTGVLFTHAPYSGSGVISLNGDFTLCSQGEDVVAGLVYTLPISEEQRKYGSYELEVSLEKDFPAIYKKLERIASYLINEKGYPHQEMEFTFEGPEEDSLYILQTRDQMITKAQEYTVFAVPRSEMLQIGGGIGIGKGVLNGLIAFSRNDIAALKDKGENLILVRPDTVPDDMDMLFECQGLLTSRGGVTSHAAVTAARLGLVGVVNCRQLKVLESQNMCRIGENILTAGQAIALDASSGHIYLGHYPIETLRTF